MLFQNMAALTGGTKGVYVSISADWVRGRAEEG